MTKREIVRTVLEGKRPPHVPWSFSFTVEAREKLAAHFGHDDLLGATESHVLGLGDDIGFFEDIGDGCVRESRPAFSANANLICGAGVAVV